MHNCPFVCFTGWNNVWPLFLTGWNFELSLRWFFFFWVVHMCVIWDAQLFNLLFLNRSKLALVFSRLLISCFHLQLMSIKFRQANLSPRVKSDFFELLTLQWFQTHFKHRFSYLDFFINFKISFSTLSEWVHSIDSF